MDTRTLFGKPIRKETTELFYPDKISIYNFVEILGLKSNHSFITNMENLGNQALQYRYIEEWTETFLVWSEIEND